MQDEPSHLQSAAEAFARAEVVRVSGAVIDDLRSQPANHIFGDVAARHLWDEYCWSLQEGPFDDDMGWDDVRLGSLSGAFEDVVRASIQSEVEKLPRHALVFLSAHAFKKDANIDKDESLGSIWIDGIVSLDLIGPHRGDAIGYEAQGSGMVWSVLSDRNEAMDLIASHCDALIDPEGDLFDLSDDDTAQVALDVIGIIHGHHIVDIWSNDVAQNAMRNAIDDYFFDVLRDERGIELPVEVLDDTETRIMDLARARFPG